MNTIDLASTWCIALHQALMESFNLEGFELLCSDLNVAIEELDGQTLADKIASLLTYMEQTQRLHSLIDACENLHSRASWYDMRLLLPQAIPFVPLAERFSLEIQPKILPKSGHCEVIISNEGIQRTSYTIVGSDPFDVLNLGEEQERQKMISPGYKAKVKLRVAPKKRPFIGPPLRHTFTVYVSTTPHNQQVAQGQIIIKPLLPAWVTTLVTRLKKLMPAREYST